MKILFITISTIFFSCYYVGFVDSLKLNNEKNLNLNSNLNLKLDLDINNQLQLEKFKKIGK
jgi:hypothetical protein